MKYFIRLGSRVSGPVYEPELRKMAATGQITRLHMISENSRDWQPASEIEGLFPKAEEKPERLAQTQAITSPAATSDSWFYSQRGQP